MSKVNEIFSKNTGITFSDINMAIKSDILCENHEIELTDIDKFITGKSNLSKKQRKKKQTKKIVSELLSFLNSGRGSGLLILGLAEERKDCYKGSKNIQK